MIDNILFFDTETTGVAPDTLHPVYDVDRYPHICQLSWTFNDMDKDFIIRPDGWTIPPETTAIHGISTEMALSKGVPFHDALKLFCIDLLDADIICAHNAQFDKRMLIADATRLTNQERGLNFEKLIKSKTCIDTMMLTIDFVGAVFTKGAKKGLPGKFPRLEELYYKLFQSSFPAHNSMEDVRALRKCYYELITRNII